MPSESPATSVLSEGYGAITTCVLAAASASARDSSGEASVISTWMTASGQAEAKAVTPSLPLPATTTTLTRAGEHSARDLGGVEIHDGVARV